MLGDPAIAAATEIRPGHFPDLEGLDLYERVIEDRANGVRVPRFRPSDPVEARQR